MLSGTAYTEVDEALDAADRGEPVILVRDHTVRQGVLALSAWSESDTPELRELADIAQRISS
ncbi:pyruvate%2C phosphate dikinase PPDK [Mycobacterium tuberculosis]|nr:pyruvate%2C phosphate dikinase PPDK [Mycobacterium tuberculosis]